jgi:hypothetical protein
MAKKKWTVMNRPFLFSENRTMPDTTQCIYKPPIKKKDEAVT